MSACSDSAGDKAHDSAGLEGDSSADPGVAHSLEALFAPVTIREFLDRYWDQQPLLIPGPADKFSGLFDRAAWEALCERRARAGDRDRTVGAHVGPEGEMQQFPVDPASAPALSRLVTVCSARVEEDDPRVARLAARLAAELGILDTIVVNCYVSPDEQGYALHYDAQDVLVLQIEGSKRWRFSARPVLYNPHEYPTLTRDGTLISPKLGLALPWPDEGSLEQAVLTPGSLLYLPGGTWHVARAQGCSLALTITCVPRHLGRLLCEVLQDLLLQEPAWRQRVPALPAALRDPDAIPDTLAGFFEAALGRFRDAVCNLDADALQRAWRRHLAQSEAALARTEPGDED